MAAKKSIKNEANLADFEKSLSEIQKIVQKMEDGKLTLEESLAYFEQGIKLTRECQTALEKAQQKVEILLKEHGKDQLKPFNAEDE